MKKLMFVAAVAASFASFGADAIGFAGAAGVYAVTATQKTLDLTYAQEEQDPIEGTGETKSEAIIDAEAQLAEIADAKKIKTTTSYDKESGTWTCKIYYSIPGDEVKSAKVITKTINGILVKGENTVAGAEDGELVLWLKDKDNRDDFPAIYDDDDKLVVPEYTGYIAKSYPDAVVTGFILVNKAAGAFVVPLTDGEEDYAFAGAGLGTSVKDTNKKSLTYGDYISIKDLSGNAVTIADGGAAMKTAALTAYGTWQIKYDASASKLAMVKGYTLAQILAKKSAGIIAD